MKIHLPFGDFVLLGCENTWISMHCFDVFRAYERRQRERQVSKIHCYVKFAAFKCNIWLLIFFFAWTYTKFCSQFLKVEIVDNILKEEKKKKKRYQQQPQLWPEKQRERVKVMCQVKYVSVSFLEKAVLTLQQWKRVTIIRV